MFANSFAHVSHRGELCRACLRKGIELHTLVTRGGFPLCVRCDDIPQEDRAKAAYAFARDQRRNGVQ